MKKIVLLILALLFALPHASRAQGADEIADRSNLAYYYAGDDGKASLTMTITDRRGRVRTREMTLLRKDVEEGGRQKFYVYFRKPSDVSRMVFMVWKQVEGDDDRWLYLPAIDLVKRIASSDKRSSFAGGAFTYEDVSGRRTGDDTHELVGEEDYKGRPVYLLKNTPRDADEVEFSYYTARIDRETLLPVRGEYFDKKGKLYRTIEVEETAVIDGFPTVLKATAENLDTGLKTTIEFEDVRYNVGIKESIFRERYLRKPPREVRR
ncbi:MAG: outer membrane lipoprotein-sorting protein [Thermodesulfobacteriota bacterium]